MSYKISLYNDNGKLLKSNVDLKNSISTQNAAIENNYKEVRYNGKRYNGN